MLRTILKSKIRRVTVTRADLHHVGSATIDADNKQIDLGHDSAYVPADAAELMSSR